MNEGKSQSEERPGDSGDHELSSTNNQETLDRFRDAISSKGINYFPDAVNKFVQFIMKYKEKNTDGVKGPLKLCLDEIIKRGKDAELSNDLLSELTGLIADLESMIGNEGLRDGDVNKLEKIRIHSQRIIDELQK